MIVILVKMMNVKKVAVAGKVWVASLFHILIRVKVSVYLIDTRFFLKNFYFISNSLIIRTH